MYTTKIKEKYRDGFYKDEEYNVICDMNNGDKVLIFNPKTKLLSDIWKNKIEDSKEETLMDNPVIVKAKKDSYKIEYNIPDIYFIVGGGIDKVKIKELHGDNIKEVFPSRLIVVDYEGKEETENND